MADYQTSVRTNLFRVQDEDLFVELINNTVVLDDEIEILTDVDADGNTLYGFSTHGLIAGVMYDLETPEGCEECSYDDFIVCLQEAVASDDAIIILEIGSSSLDDSYATATIVTSEDTEYIDLQDIASSKALEMLADVWSTK